MAPQKPFGPRKVHAAMMDDIDDMLAAEYAIGLLQNDEMHEVRLRTLYDREFALRVSAWEQYLVQLVDFIPVQPPSTLRAKILAEMFEEKPQVIPLWQRLGLWQAITGGALALSALLGLFLFQEAKHQTSSTVSASEIVSSTGDFRVLALLDKADNAVVLTQTLGGPSPGRVLEVWAHGPNQPARSLGLWLEGENARFMLPDEIADTLGELTLGVSEEAPGGSRIGSPSGRVFGTTNIPKSFW